MPDSLQVKKITPVLVVDAIEPCLTLWVDRLGFAKTVEVPDGNVLGFAILVKDGVEVMYQTRASIEKDAPTLDMVRGDSAALFIEVSDIDTIERAVMEFTVAVPRRRTFYGMDEVGILDPAGHLIVFAQAVTAGA